MLKEREFAPHNLLVFIQRAKTGFFFMFEVCLVLINRFSPTLLVRTECSECKNGECPNISYQECDISKLPRSFYLY